MGNWKAEGQRSEKKRAQQATGLEKRKVGIDWGLDRVPEGEQGKKNEGKAGKWKFEPKMSDGSFLHVVSLSK